MSRDPIGELGGMNLYAFVGNNPTNLIDPHGLLTGVEETAVIYAITAVVGAAIIYFTSPAWDEASRGMADATRNFISNINLDFAVGSEINLLNPNIAGNTSCPMGPNNDDDDYPPKFTKEMHNKQQRIKRLTDAKKDQLVNKFGGKRSLWKKYKTWDASGQEWHYYYNKQVGRVGFKHPGQLDPF